MPGPLSSIALSDDIAARVRPASRCRRGPLGGDGGSLGPDRPSLAPAATVEAFGGADRLRGATHRSWRAR